MAGVAREKPLGPVYFRGEVGAARCICIDNAPYACPRGEMLFIARPLPLFLPLPLSVSLVLPRRGKNIINLGAFTRHWPHRIAWPIPRSEQNDTRYTLVTLSSLPCLSSSPLMNSSRVVFSRSS